MPACSIERTRASSRLPVILLCLVALLFVGASCAGAQDRKEIFQSATFWSKIEINDFTERGNWGWGVDGILRRKNVEQGRNIFESPMRESVRPWLHYNFSPMARLSVSPLGYMNTNEYVPRPEDRGRDPYHELRSTVQFFHHHKQLSGRLIHTWRYRYELRWQEQPGQPDYRYTNRFRFRYRVRYGLNSNDFYEDKTIYLTASNELNINLGREVTYNTFNQNRVYAGVGMRFLNAARAEVRYVDRFRTRGATGYQFDRDRGLMLAISIDQFGLLGSKDVQRVRYFD